MNSSHATSSSTLDSKPAPPLADLEAEVFYLAAREPAPRAYYREGSDVAERTARYEPYRVAVQNAREVAESLSLDREGFVLLDRKSAVSDFYDEDRISGIYYTEVEQLVMEETGAKEVVVFDHTVRVQRADGETIGQRAPVRLVHNDYTHRSGPQRVRDLLDDERAQRWLGGRVAEYNLWRPIRGPVMSMPLAILAADSVAPDDLVTADLIYPDRSGEIYNAVHNPNHRWFYVPAMQANEALLFKGYDSKMDGRARFTLHTAFELPSSPTNAPSRESIEIRALAYLG